MDVKEENPPQLFVNWATMTKVLEQANTDGVKCTIFMKLDGALLCVAGDSSIEKIIGALVANIWKSYDTGAKKAFDADNLYFMIIDCEEGKLAVARISKFLLCTYADKNVQLGLLKTKITALVEHLKPLKKVYET